MTNLHKNFGIILFAALFTVLAGCKKDESVASFVITDATSYDFEYDQTKEVSFSTNKIVKFNEPEVPGGWTCVRSGGKFVITSPAASNSGAYLSGTVKVSCETDGGTTLTRSITVAVRIAEDITAPANSYIVSTPYKRYKFNALRRGNEASETLKGKATGGYRLWTTSTAAIVNVSFENGYIYFATGNAETLVEGNAVVVVHDKDENILWSWHIWVTGDDVLASVDELGSAVMTRNLGAFTNSNASAQDAWRSYGLYYQWGRKDPFVGPGAWNSTTQQSLYDSSGSYVVHAYEASTAGVGTVEYAIAHPATFIAGAEGSEYDWLYAAHNNSLWNGASKTIYDPCPAGWRVAPPEIWASFTTENTLGDYNYGWTFDALLPVVSDPGEEPSLPAEGIFFPAAGRRSFSPTLAGSARNYTNIVNDGEGKGSPVGFYWSNTPVSLVFNSNRIDPASSKEPRAGGFPLRCIAE